MEKEMAEIERLVGTASNIEEAKRLAREYTEILSKEDQGKINVVMYLETVTRIVGGLYDSHPQEAAQLTVLLTESTTTMWKSEAREVAAQWYRDEHAKFSEEIPG